jgi:tRNA (guanine37-N1)-methyltransferase
MPIETHGLRVPKQQGQKTFEVANLLKLVDRKLEIRRGRNFLCIPLINQLSEHDLKILKDSGVNFALTTCQFEERKKEEGTLGERLRGRLPQRLLENLPRSIDFVGDLAVVEIPEELQTRRKIIGEAILRSNRNVHTVLSKAGAINGIFRTRTFDFLAGERTTKTLHKEHGCKYELDLAKVYFSPRLSHEHKRVASSVQEGETVVDLFTGVGPFAILIAKTHENVKVYAIDANPEAVKYLKTNVRINRVMAKVHPLLGDARQVIRGKTSCIADRIVMNLPEKAIEFVDVACRALKGRGGTIHFYFFMDSSNSLETAKANLLKAVAESKRRVKKIIGQRIVRETAPYRAQAVLDVEVS